jgi:Leucine-rich repeat (LRR) protein
MTWTDSLGNHTDTLAGFNATANKATVNRIQEYDLGIDSITGLQSLPALVTLRNLQNNITTLDCLGCPLLKNVNLEEGSLTVLSVNTILNDLLTNGQTGGSLNLSIQLPSPPSVGPPNGIVAMAALLAEVPAWTVATD